MSRMISVGEKKAHPGLKHFPIAIFLARRFVKERTPKQHQDARSCLSSTSATTGEEGAPVQQQQQQGACKKEERCL